MPNPIHVLAGVIRDDSGRVLLARRPEHLHQGGLWEFPGGKREGGEAPLAALLRELREELGITVRAARPRIRVMHDYAAMSVLLDVWDVTAYSGTPTGMEGQALAWAAVETLSEYAFPAANYPIVTSIGLPALYGIVPAPEGAHADQAAWLARVERLCAAGARLLQVRCRAPAAGLADAVRAAHRVAAAHGARLLVNGRAGLSCAALGDGIHLTAAQLHQFAARPLPAGKLVGASCHNRLELELAARLGADFAVLAPVRPTRSHPGARTLGWHGVSKLLRTTRLPVFALGGMGPEHMYQAHRLACQGVAMLSGLWEAPDPAAVIEAALSASRRAEHHAFAAADSRRSGPTARRH